MLFNSFKFKANNLLAFAVIEEKEHSLYNFILETIESSFLLISVFFSNIFKYSFTKFNPLILFHILLSINFLLYS